MKPRKNPDKVVIHILLHGVALCPISRGENDAIVLPIGWPPGHLWVSVLDHSNATCAECAQVFARFIPTNTHERLDTNDTEQPD